MKAVIDIAKDMVKHNKIIMISDSFWEVDNHKVSLRKKPGRKFFTCDCTNHTLYCNSNPMCIHILAVIVYLANKDFLKRMDKLIKEYENYKELKLKPSIDCIINDLNDVKYKF